MLISPKKKKNETPTLVYVAFPFRAPSRDLIERNILEAVEYGKHVLKHGMIPVVPHINSFAMFGFQGDDTDVVRFDDALLGSCDELWVCGDTISKGMYHEIEFATRSGIPIYYVKKEIYCVEEQKGGERV